MNKKKKMTINDIEARQQPNVKKWRGEKKNMNKRTHKDLQYCYILYFGKFDLLINRMTK